MTTITCSAPGSIIFTGKYTASEYPSVVAAINQHFTVSVTPIDDPVLDISSDLCGPCTINLSTLSAPPTYQYTLSSFKQFLPQLRHQGFQIVYHKNTMVDKQLGMNAAITVILSSAFYHYLHHHTNLGDIFRIASQAVSAVRPDSSCAEVAASTYGKIIHHTEKNKSHPTLIESFLSDLPLFAVYSGTITSESIAIKRCLIRERSFPSIYSKLHAILGDLSHLFFQELKNNNVKKLGELMEIGQGILSTNKLQTKETQEILSRLDHTETVYGAKITGPGLGGCVIGLGTIEQEILAPFELIPLQIEHTGVRILPSP